MTCYYYAGIYQKQKWTELKLKKKKRKGNKLEKITLERRIKKATSKEVQREPGHEIIKTKKQRKLKFINVTHTRTLSKQEAFNIPHGGGTVKRYFCLLK